MGGSQSTVFRERPISNRKRDARLRGLQDRLHQPAGGPIARAVTFREPDRLAASTECFNVVYFHHPAYSSGDPVFTEPRMRWPFGAWGADVVLMGHQHQYERLVVDNMTYVVDGLGGALNRFDFATTQPGSMIRYKDDFGALAVEVYDGRLSFIFKNTRDQPIDAFDLTRDCAQPHLPADGGS